MSAAANNGFIPNSFEYGFQQELAKAKGVIIEALEYSRVNPDTAPVRYAAVERGVKYAVYTTLGFTGMINLITPEYIGQVDRETQSAIREIRYIAQVESRAAAQESAK